MSKWISGFLPCKCGSYLVMYTYNLMYNQSISYTNIKRLEYNSIKNIWMDREGSRVLANIVKQDSLVWWDEYGIAENKTVIKLSFTKPQNREI